MCSASTANAHIIRLSYAWFLQSEYFHSSQYASLPCHSAGSQRQNRRILLSESTLSLGVLIVFKDPSPSAREVSVQLKEPYMGEGGILAVGHGEDTIKGIFPKTPEKM